MNREGVESQNTIRVISDNETSVIKVYFKGNNIYNFLHSEVQLLQQKCDQNLLPICIHYIYVTTYDILPAYISVMKIRSVV